MLILAATPIGNLEDASPRLARVLRDADHLFAEDTRQSRKLLQHLGVERRLDAFHDHSGPGVLSRIGAYLQEGKTVAYISDAGMPGISDPGFELVRLAHELDVAVDVIPGPSSVINALVLSGLPCHAFCFLGFFPTTEQKRMAVLERLQLLEMTAIFFEAPTRIKHTLAFLHERIPATELAVCREMTKIHQQVLRGRPDDIISRLEIVKGEFVLVIGPVKEEKKQDLNDRYRALLEKGNSPSQSVKILARETRLQKREIYKKVVTENLDLP